MKTPNFHYGQVWLVQDQSKIRHGSIQQKMRPMIIISNEKNNIYSPILNVIPLTGSRDLPRGSYQIQYYLGLRQTPITVLCEQITTISKEDCVRYLYTLSDDILTEVQRALRIQLSL
jgi:mRNA-degrading endonuclease toxin of MazEF toxin-antitoxin module